MRDLIAFGKQQGDLPAGDVADAIVARLVTLRVEEARRRARCSTIGGMRAVMQEERSARNARAIWFAQFNPFAVGILRDVDADERRRLVRRWAEAGGGGLSTSTFPEWYNRDSEPGSVISR